MGIGCLNVAASPPQSFPSLKKCNILLGHYRSEVTHLALSERGWFVSTSKQATRVSLWAEVMVTLLLRQYIMNYPPMNTIFPLVWCFISIDILKDMHISSAE